jgi:hypothetical protein
VGNTDATPVRRRSTPLLYRITETPDPTLDNRWSLYKGRDLVGRGDTHEDLRRLAERHAGYELDWRGGEVRNLNPFQLKACHWQASAEDTYQPAA